MKQRVRIKLVQRRRALWYSTHAPSQTHLPSEERRSVRTRDRPSASSSDRRLDTERPGISPSSNSPVGAEIGAVIPITKSAADQTFRSSEDPPQ